METKYEIMVQFLEILERSESKTWNFLREIAKFKINWVKRETVCVLACWGGFIGKKNWS